MKKIVCLSLAFFAVLSSFAQIHVLSYKIPSKYLLNGQVMINPTTPTTTIEYEVTFSGVMDYETGYVKPASTTVAIGLNGTSLGNSSVYSSQAKTVSFSEFPKEVSIITKTYSASITRSHLNTSLKIDVWQFISSAGHFEPLNKTPYSYTLQQPTQPTNPTGPSFDINNANLFTISGNRIRRIDNNTGGYISIGQVEWMNANAMTSLDDFLYIAQAGSIHKVSKIDGSWSIISGNSQGTLWANTEAMTALDGYLYVVQNSRVHKLDKNTGVYGILSTDWGGTEGIAALDGFLYIVQNSYLHKVDKSSGNYSILSGSWNGTEAMTALDGYLYIVQNGYLHKVDKTNGSYSILGGQVWNGTSGMTSYGGYLYIFQNNRLHKVDKNTGAYGVLSVYNWGDMQAITSL